MCPSSFRLSSGIVTMLLHLSSNVLMTPNFWYSRWCELMFRYWTVCVFILYTRNLTVPSSFRTINVSGNGSDHAYSSSYWTLCCLCYQWCLGAVSIVVHTLSPRSPLRHPRTVSTVAADSFWSCHRWHWASHC